MKNIIIYAGLIACLCIGFQKAYADSVDVFIPQREVTMNSSDMAKKFDEAARKIKEGYSKKGTTSTTPSSTTMPSASPFSQQTQPRKYTSQWT